MYRDVTNRPFLLVTIPEACRRFGLDSRTVRRAIGQGRLAAYTVGTRWARVDLDEVAQWN